MKKIIIVLASVCMMANVFSCKTKSGDAACTAPTIAKFLATGKEAEYKLSVTGDTSVKYIFTSVTQNIVQQKNTKMNILGTTTNSIPHYLKACGKDIAINSEATNMDALLAAKNFYVIGDRPEGSSWNYTLNGQTHFCGCKKKDLVYTSPYGGTYKFDKIWNRTSPAPTSPADTIYWNDTFGVVANYGVSGSFILMKKNF
jgi:hypothetical protein